MYVRGGGSDQIWGRWGVGWIYQNLLEKSVLLTSYFSLLFTAYSEEFYQVNFIPEDVLNLKLVMSSFKTVTPFLRVSQNKEMIMDAILGSVIKGPKVGTTSITARHVDAISRQKNAANVQENEQTSRMGEQVRTKSSHGLLKTISLTF